MQMCMFYVKMNSCEEKVVIWMIVGNTEYYYYSCIQLGTFFLITCIVLLENVNVTVIVFFPLEWHPIWWTLFRDTSIGLINNCQLFQFSLEEIVGFII